MAAAPQETSSPRPLPSGAARLRRLKGKRERFRSKTRWLILAMIVIFSVGLVVSGSGRDFLRYWLYSPLVIFIAILAGVEYIVLKGRDKSRLYRLDLEQMRERRRQDVDFLREMEEELRQMEEQLQKGEYSDIQARLTAIRTRVGRKL